MKWVSPIRNLHRWETQRRKAPKRQPGSTSCLIHSSPSMVSPKTRTTVLIHQNRDPVHLHSTHDLGLSLHRLRRNRATVRTLWSLHTPSRDKALSRSIRPSLAHLVHIITVIRFPEGRIGRLAMPLNILMGTAVTFWGIRDTSTNAWSRLLSRSTSKTTSSSAVCRIPCILTRLVTASP